MPTKVPSARTLAGSGAMARVMRKLLPVGLFFAAGLMLIVAVGLAQRLGWIRAADHVPGDSATTGSMFSCPMHPQIRQPAPGRCPICGMALVPVANLKGANLDELAVTIEPAQRRLANIQTAQVESGPVESILHTFGVIAIDESRQSTIAAYVDGRLERLFADYTGMEIAKGDHLAVIYSLPLYSRQLEFVQTIQALAEPSTVPEVRRTHETFAASARQRLRELGMTESQLAELERSGQAQSRLTIHSPQGGTVMEKLAVEGNYVKAGDPIYRVADLSTVWLLLKLFPEDAARVRFGQRVQATVQSLPGEQLAGRVAFIDPAVNAQTRAVDVRVELLNPHKRLRPGDYGEARVHLPIGPQGQVFDLDLAGKWISPMHPQIVRDQPGQCPICGMDLVPTSRYGFSEKPVSQPHSLHVPRLAVLLAGGNSIVYVETNPGRFEIRPVTVGPILRDKVVILDGLQAGESVATAGNFLIDSQMQLAGKPSLVDPARAIAKRNERQGVLVFQHVAITVIGGETGVKLEAMYAAYFKVQQALAADTKPPVVAAQSLHQAASELGGNANLPEPSQKLLRHIATKSEHLPHLDLAGARQAFRPISQAVVTLATQVRGEEAQQSFTHYYCAMVAGGGGDWLQAGGEPLNPYFGTEMLHCGEKVQEFPAHGQPAPHPEHEAAPSQTKGA